jgi:hypothetical protein
MAIPPFRSLSALGITLFLVLKGLAPSPHSNANDCHWMSRRVAEVALGDSVHAISDDNSCGYRSASPESSGRVEVSLLDYPSSALAQSAYQVQLGYSRADSSRKVRLESGLGSAAFCAVTGVADDRLAWMDVLGGSHRLVVKLAGVAGDPELLEARARVVAEATWESLDQ